MYKFFKPRFLVSLLILLALLSVPSILRTKILTVKTTNQITAVLKILTPILKKDEGFYSCPYKCPAGSLTVGFGHVIRSSDTWMKDCLSEKQADTLLAKDIVESYAMLQLTDARYLEKLPLQAIAGLLRFQCNIGSFGFKKSTVHKMFEQVFFRHPEYLACESVDKIVAFDKTQFQLERVLCKAGVGSAKLCKQFIAFEHRQQLRTAFKLWNKITVNGHLKVLPALTKRRISELEMVMPTCKGENTKIVL